MIKKIKEFIKAFKDAYYTLNINKFNAKNAIEETEILDGYVAEADVEDGIEVIESDEIPSIMDEDQIVWTTETADEAVESEEAVE